MQTIFSLTSSLKGGLGDCIGLQRARSGAGRVAMDSRMVCTTLYV